MLSKFRAHCIIHTFALTHGVTAFCLAQTPEGDTLALTAETITFIISLAKACGAKWTVAMAKATATQAIANYTGVAIAETARHYIKYIPVAGNTFNAGTSIAICECIGWTVYHELTKAVQ